MHNQITQAAAAPYLGLCMHVNTHERYGVMYAHIYTHVCVCMYVYIYICMYIYIYINLYIYMMCHMPLNEAEEAPQLFQHISLAET